MARALEKRLITQTFRYELDPSEAQRVVLTKSVGASRFVYNWGLAESKREYELAGRRPSLAELKARLVRLKRSECPWLYEVSAHIGQQALADLERAFERFFKGLKGGGPRSGHPRFKRKGEHDSCRVYEIDVFDRHVRLPRIGKVRLKERSSKLEGRILSATISRRVDRWFVSLAVEREREIVLPRETIRGSDVVGVDLGLAHAAVSYDGTTAKLVEGLRPLRKSIERLRRLDRQLARKQKGSANYRKAKLGRARLYYRISNQRRDFLHKLSSGLAKTKPVIVLEDLHVKGMQRNRKLALSVSDAGLGELRRQLAYKCEWYGSRLLIADRYQPSTQACSACGALNEQVRGFGGLKERTFACEACGLVLNRDENAARNLRSWGLRALASELPEGLREGTPVSSARRALAASPAGLAGEDGSGLLPQRKAKPSSMKQEAIARRSRRDPQMCEETRTGVG